MHQRDHFVCLYFENMIIWFVIFLVKYIHTKKSGVITDFLNFLFNMQDIGPAPNNFLQDLMKLCRTGIYKILKFKRQTF
jgi:hypothetical protein